MKEKNMMHIPKQIHGQGATRRSRFTFGENRQRTSKTKHINSCQRSTNRKVKRLSSGGTYGDSFWYAFYIHTYVYIYIYIYIHMSHRLFHLSFGIVLFPNRQRPWLFGVPHSMSILCPKACSGLVTNLTVLS